MDLSLFFAGTAGSAPTAKRGPAKSGNYFWSCTAWRKDGTGCDAPPMWIHKDEPDKPDKQDRS